MNESLTTVTLFILSILFAVIGWLLSNKILAIQKELELLWAQHHEDVSDLTNFKIEVAKEHYPKRELDDKFRVISEAISSGFSSLGGKFDTLASALMNHIINEELKK